MEHLRILHTNDLHSHFENFPKIGRFLNQAQADFQADRVFTFDAGDFMDRSHPLTDATEGRFNVELMNGFHYDAITIGNNEGISNSHATLEHLFDHAKFPVLLANLREEDGSFPRWAEPYKIFTSPRGTRIAVIGFTAAYPMTYGPNHWRVYQPAKLLPKLLGELQGRYDLLFLLTHIGYLQDRKLAKQFPKIDLIIGGHSHTLLPGGTQCGRTWIVQTGKWGRFIGDVALTLDDEHRLLSIKPKTIAVADLPAAPGDEELVADYRQDGEQKLDQHKVADLPDKFAGDKSAALQASLAAIADFAGTKLAMLNSGLFLTPFKAGVITKKDLQKALPHPMHVVRVSLKGRDLWRLVREVAKNQHFLHKFHLQGMSFRGKIFGNVYFQGIKYDPVTKKVYVEGRKINPDQTYQIAVLDHHILVPFFPTLAIMGKNEFLFPKFLREVVGDYLAKKYPLKTGDDAHDDSQKQ